MTFIMVLFFPTFQFLLNQSSYIITTIQRKKLVSQYFNERFYWHFFLDMIDLKKKKHSKSMATHTMKKTFLQFDLFCRCLLDFFKCVNVPPRHCSLLDLLFLLELKTLELSPILTHFCMWENQEFEWAKQERKPQTTGLLNPRVAK